MCCRSWRSGWLRVSDAARIAELERQVAKLTKVNNALMQRVQRDMDQQGSAFSLVLPLLRASTHETRPPREGVLSSAE